MTTSALLRHGIEHLGTLRIGLGEWMKARDFSSLAEVRGKLSQQMLKAPVAYERVNYVRILQTAAGKTVNSIR